MKYPVPSPEEYYLFDHEVKTETNTQKIKKTESAIQQEYKAHILKNQKLLASIPFVENIYLCNSMTFNGLKDDSDIDLVIIAREGKIRTVKLCTTIYLFFRGLRRHGKNVRKKFCTSFYLTPKGLNLFPLKLHNSTDIYLIYWLAHLVSLYSRDKKSKDILLQHNTRIQNFLPNHPLKQTVDLGITNQTGTQTGKARRERILNGIIGAIIEQLIKYIRLPIILWKKSKLNKKANIIIHDTILKFYQDKRAQIQFLFDLNKLN